MNTEERLNKQRELIEEIGKYHDQEGFQPITGRILAMLMIMDKEQFTFDEIVEELKISKASASLALKNLEIRGKVEYVTIPGDRKKYYRIKKYDDIMLIDDFKEKMLFFKQLLDRITDLKADKESSNSQFFKSIIHMLNYFEQKIEELKHDYKQNE
jgi:DNA-binding transcriptional regulator GbsR (MarR family)